MKKFVLLAVLVAAMPLTTMAQDDDLYFNPKQEAKKEAALREQRAKAYARVRAVRDSLYAIHWSGSPRSVDEYNRNGRILSHYQGITTDSLGNDIISFRLEKGVKPDSIYDDEAFAQKFINQDEDFEYTRDLSRWDGYYNPWFYDYYGVGPYYWRSGYWGARIITRTIPTAVAGITLWISAVVNMSYHRTTPVPRIVISTPSIQPWLRKLTRILNLQRTV